MASAIGGVADLKHGIPAADEPRVLEDVANRAPESGWADALGQLLGRLTDEGWLEPCHGPWDQWAVHSSNRTQFFELVHPADRDVCRSELDACSESPRRFRLRCLRSDGSWAWVDWTVANRPADAQLGGGWTKVLAGQLAAHQGPAAASARDGNDSRSTIEHVPERVWLADADGLLTFGNRAMLEFVGQDEFRAGGWRSICDPQHLEPVEDALGAVLASGRGATLRCRILDRDSVSRWCILRISAKLGDRGEVLGLVGSCSEVHDLPAAMMLHRACRGFASESEALQDLGLLAGGVAHDFNNLLTVIQGNLEICALDAREDQAPMLEGALAAAGQAAGLCRKILVFAGKGSLVRERLDLNSVALSACRPFQGQEWDGPAVQVVTTSEALDVEGDRHQLAQVLQNLVTNGLDAVRGTGRRLGFVRVRCGVSQIDGERWAWMRCSDNGLGMDRATVLRMFEPYYSTKGSGRGLGLAAAQGIVRAHEGVLSVQSEPGVGTTVQVLLPLAPALPEREPGDGEGHSHGESPGSGRTAPEACSPPAPDVGDLEGLRVLVVDDEDGVRDLARTMLEGMGCTVVEVDGGVAALAELERAPFDVLLTDLSMPDLDGAALLAEVGSRGSELATVLMSGYAPDVTARSAAGAFLQKPFSADGLRDAVGNAWVVRGRLTEVCDGSG